MRTIPPTNAYHCPGPRTEIDDEIDDAIETSGRKRCNTQEQQRHEADVVA